MCGSGGGRAAVAAELRAGRERRAAVRALLRLHRLAAVRAELRPLLHLRLAVRALDRRRRCWPRLHVRAAVLTELRAREVRRVALRTRHRLLRRRAAAARL